MATDPHAQNDDSDRMCISADGYRIGQAGGEIAVAFMLADMPSDIGLIFGKDEALEFLGRLSIEMQAQGWLS
ncbi:hypothetical protein [Novosphingobium sp.]|uniref:hypothetical protein n=1 Tax=Novosphingobium sp. TaxID=1874826 RepID=UPI00262763E5|nr:hypothetical protein [Novosphingobium sp.]